MLHFNAAQTALLVWGLAAHGVGDWLLQNDWVARHKHDPLHPAAGVHAGLHALLGGLIFGAAGAGVIFASHFWIDTRWPANAWGRLLRQTDAVRPGARVVLHVQLWRDQVFHALVLALLAYGLGR